jgi:hypothetical protein
MASVRRPPAVRGYLQVTETDEVFGTRKVGQPVAGGCFGFLGHSPSSVTSVRTPSQKSPCAMAAAWARRRARIPAGPTRTARKCERIGPREPCGQVTPVKTCRPCRSAAAPTRCRAPPAATRRTPRLHGEQPSNPPCSPSLNGSPKSEVLRCGFADPSKHERRVWARYRWHTRPREASCTLRSFSRSMQPTTPKSLQAGRAPTVSCKVLACGPHFRKVTWREDPAASWEGGKTAIHRALCLPGAERPPPRTLAALSAHPGHQPRPRSAWWRVAGH